MSGGGRWEGGAGGGRGPNYPDDMSGGRSHALKVLCPNQLISSIMGHRGAVKDEIQEATGCKLIFSGREEFYPGTQLRVLVIYGDRADMLLPALDRIIDHSIECGEEESNHPPAGETLFLGKEYGEYWLKIAISQKMSGAVIGPRGTTVQAIREESGAKIFIEKEHFQGHQMLKMVATPEGLRTAAMRVNECIHEDAGSEAYREWASVRRFAEATDEWQGWGRAAAGGKGGHKGGKRGGEHQRHQEAGGGRDRERSPRRAHAADSGGGAPKGGGAEDAPDIDTGVLQAVSATLEQFPDGALDMEYTLACDLPVEKVTYLIGRKGEGVQGVQQSTGTEIRFESHADPSANQRTLIIVGPLLRVYHAHALMMRRYHEADMEPADKNVPAETVRQLQEQLAAIQKQIDSLQGLDHGGGKGRGKKGH